MPVFVDVVKNGAHHITSGHRVDGTHQVETTTGHRVVAKAVQDIHALEDVRLQLRGGSIRIKGSQDTDGTGDVRRCHRRATLVIVKAILRRDGAGDIDARCVQINRCLSIVRKNGWQVRPVRRTNRNNQWIGITGGKMLDPIIVLAIVAGGGHEKDARVRCGLNGDLYDTISCSATVTVVTDDNVHALGQLVQHVVVGADQCG